MLAWLNQLSNRFFGTHTPADQVPPRELRTALKHPQIRRNMIQFSLEEFDCNTYYASLHEKVAIHQLGPCPTLAISNESIEISDLVEDQAFLWTSHNRIGEALRNLRIEAMKTGYALGIPYTRTDPCEKTGLSFKIYGADTFRTPQKLMKDPFVHNGIRYDKNTQDPTHIYIIDGDPRNKVKKEIEVDLKDVLHWGRSYFKSTVAPIPECIQALTIYPSIRRYIEAVVKTEEFKQSTAMALEVDADIYGPMKDGDKKATPRGNMSVEPGTIYTLPPGTKLAGIPKGDSSADRVKLLKTLAGCAGQIKHVPENVAVGSSQDSNMAASQVDIQIWKMHVEVERTDFHCVVQKAYDLWWNIASKTDKLMGIGNLNMDYNYATMFSHPDPLKKSKSSSNDLQYGMTTLAEIYSSRGKNPRREFQREADLLDITVEELYNKILEQRFKDRPHVEITAETEPNK